MSFWDPKNVPAYPPPRYTAAEPEVSATVRRGDTPADYDSFGLVQYHYLANQQLTGGDYGLHYHRAMSEAFFVLSGSVEIYDGAQWSTTGTNDFLYVPPGGIHGFRNTADAPASMLMLFAPGAPREHYFEGLAHLGELTDEERAQWFVDNDNFFV